MLFLVVAASHFLEDWENGKMDPSAEDFNQGNGATAAPDADAEADGAADAAAAAPAAAEVRPRCHVACSGPRLWSGLEVVLIAASRLHSLSRVRVLRNMACSIGMRVQAVFVAAAGGRGALDAAQRGKGGAGGVVAARQAGHRPGPRQVGSPAGMARCRSCAVWFRSSTYTGAALPLRNLDVACGSGAPWCVQIVRRGAGGGHCIITSC